MGPGRSNNFVYIVITVVTGWVSAQDYYEEHHRNQIRSQVEHFTEIPKKFEVEGENAIADFNKHVTNIQKLAAKKNLHVTYKVNVNTIVKTKHRKQNMDKLNGKSKKYNIPLKKKNMKLSSFEIILKKRGNIGLNQYNHDDETTTDRQKVIYTTRQPSSGKYKPVVSGVKRNMQK